jgi:hypothetical protein
LKCCFPCARLCRCGGRGLGNNRCQAGRRYRRVILPATLDFALTSRLSVEPSPNGSSARPLDSGLKPYTAPHSRLDWDVRHGFTMPGSPASRITRHEQALFAGHPSTRRVGSVAARETVDYPPMIRQK